MTKELCVDDASHFDSVPGLLYMAYVKKENEHRRGQTVGAGKAEKKLC